MARGRTWSIDRLPNFYADILYRQNVRSVGYRYPEDSIDSLPGDIFKPANVICTERDEVYMRPVPALHLLKMCNCLSYQSCETDDWQQTAAFELLRSIKEQAIRNLPGYDDAPWDYTEEYKLRTATKVVQS